MEKKPYNFNSDELENIPDLLASLPKIEAPDDFEFKLMARIQNGNFGSEERRITKSKSVFNWIPAVVFSAAAVVLFFLVSSPSQDALEFPSFPALRTSGNDTIVLKEHRPANRSVAESSAKAKITSKSNRIALEKPQPETYAVMVQPNDIVKKQKVTYPFDQTHSVNIDKAITGSRVGERRPGLSTVSQGGMPEYFEFRGFDIRSKEDQETLRALKSRMDSIWRIKNNSKIK